MSKSILEKFGQNVRAERIKQSLSQEKLGELAGLHRTYIGMIERAEKNITLLNIEKNCQRAWHKRITFDGGIKHIPTASYLFSK